MSPQPTNGTTNDVTPGELNKKNSTSKNRVERKVALAKKKKKKAATHSRMSS